MIHLMNATGKTLCGLLMKEAGIVTDNPRTASCPECKRVLRKRAERVVKEYPEGSVAHSDAWKMKK